MGGGFTLCAALPLPVQSCPHRGSRQEIQGREAAQTGTARACRSSSRKEDTRLADLGPKFTSNVCQAHGGRSSTVKGDGASEKESQMRHLGTKSTLWIGAAPHPLP